MPILNMLINWDKQYEGYNRAVKLLMKHIESKKKFLSFKVIVMF